VNPQAVINEYGSNFVKYKQDPLVTIEAKNALHGSSKDEFFQFDNIISKSGSSKVLPTIVEDKEEERTSQRAISISLVKGSQGAPEIDLSSQEEAVQKEIQDTDWDLIQEEDGQNSKMIEMGIENEKGKGIDKSEQLAISEEKELTTVEENQRKVTTKTLQLSVDGV
jgi:hypothetical protein